MRTILFAMKSLFLLIALYTISGKQVEPSGDIPVGATCAYEQTGSKSGQMTAGNSITLTLEGYDGATLNSVRLAMHSNKDAGSGSLKMTVGSTSVWTITDAPFNASVWAGMYSNEEWVSVTHSLGGTIVPDNAPIKLVITASKNSLYLQSVELSYAEPAPRSHTVTFVTHISERIDPITETQPNTGVLLPSVSLDDADWQFVGWAEQGVMLTAKQPSMYFPGERYYPAYDCTLHAVYVQEGEFEPWLPTDNVQSGDYVIALYNAPSSNLWYATGAVTNGMLATISLGVEGIGEYVTMPTSVARSESVYTLTIDGEQVAIHHKASDTDVFLTSGGKLSQSSSIGKTWQLKPVDDAQDMPHYALSGEVGGITYYLSYHLAADGILYFCPTTDATMRHDFLLYNLDDFVDIPSQYTSFPFGDDVPSVTPDNLPEYKLHIGSCILTVKNGKKYLQINE